jgi:hypothetical protein
LAFSLIALVVIALLNAAGCGDPPTSSIRARGLRDLPLVGCVIALPWLIVALVNRGRRWSIALGAVIGLAPLCLFAATHTTIGSWTGGACLF